jgi:hypothetical protein
MHTSEIVDVCVSKYSRTQFDLNIASATEFFGVKIIGLQKQKIKRKKGKK